MTYIHDAITALEVGNSYLVPRKNICSQAQAARRAITAPGKPNTIQELKLTPDVAMPCSLKTL